MSSNIYDSTAKKLIPFAGNSEATAGSLDGLSDVNISSPTDGQTLTYDAANDVWVNGAGATVIESLGDIADVDLTNLEDGQTIVWDATEEKWVPGTSGTSLTAGFGISIENDEIKTTDFVGTQAQWDALTPTQKESYDFVHITDDSSDVTYSPGHAISDGTTEKTQREVLEFEGFTVTDDSVNGKTKVAEVPYTAGDGVEITEKEISVSDEISRTLTCTTAEWNAIVDKSVYDGWIINLTDDHASGVGVVVDTVEDGNMNAVTSNAVYNSVSKMTWKTVATASSIAASGTTVSLHADAIHSKQDVRVTYYSDNARVPLTQYGSSGTAREYRGSVVSPDSSAFRLGFVLKWESADLNTCTITYYTNGTASALNTAVSVQVWE